MVQFALVKTPPKTDTEAYKLAQDLPAVLKSWGIDVDLNGSTDYVFYLAAKSLMRRGWTLKGF